MNIFGYKITKDRLCPELPYTIEKEGIFVGIGENKEEVLDIIRKDISGANDTQNIQIIGEEKSIELTVLACKKLFYYADACPEDEISGLGTVKNKGNKYIVTDVFTFKQRSSGGGTKLSKQDMALFITKWAQGGKNPSHLRLWWHTHANGSPFWSATDMNNIDNFSCDSFMVSIVLNSIRHQMLGRVDVYQPERITIDDIQPTVNFQNDPRLKYKCYREARKKNRRVKYVQERLYQAGRYIQPKIFTNFY